MPRRVPTPIYVTKLFELLRFLGLGQQAVVEALGVSKTQVSFWAHGLRAIPKHQARRLWQFLRQALEDADWRAREADHPLGAVRSLLQLSSYEAFRSDANSHIRAWILELGQTRGWLNAAIQQRLELITSYRRQDLMKCSREDRQRLERLLDEVKRYLRDIEVVLDRPEERFWRGGPPAPDVPPVVYLAHAMELAGISEDLETEA